MTTGFRNSGGTDFDNVFDPYVQGTKPGVTGYRTSDGVDLNQRFAPIVFGSAASVTGFRLSSGADVNTLWAAKGTAVYGLPIDGSAFVAKATTAGSSSSATLNFNTNNSTFSVTDPNNGTLASGSIPAGATKCQVTFTLTAGTTATQITNSMSSPATLTGTTLSASVGNTVVGSGQPAILSTYDVTIKYQNSAGTVISTSNCSFEINTNHT